MLSNDLHLRLHYRETRHASGLIAVRKIPTTLSGIRSTPRTGESNPPALVFPSPEPSKAFVPENEIEAQWLALLRLWPCPEEMPGCPPSPRPLIEAAMERPELRRLYPYTHAYTLCFRYAPDARAANDLPTAAPIDRDYFQAFAPGSWTPLGEGDAKQVVRLMAEVVVRSYVVGHRRG
jgi:hypothetical protein